VGAVARSRHRKAPPSAPRTTIPYVRGVCLILLGSWGFAASAARDKPESVAVEVVGLRDEVKQNVEAHLSIAKVGERSGGQPDPPAGSTPSEENVRRLHAVARTEIEEALQPFGYYAPTVTSMLQRADRGWLARYDVDPGDPTLLGEVEIRVLGQGRHEPGMREALAAIELSTGDVLNHPQYETAKQRLFSAAYDAGYIDVAYERSEILVQPHKRLADIHLVLETGPKYFFGDLAIEQEILDPGLIARFVEIARGDPFDPNRLIELQLALGDSGYFSNVTVDVMRDAAVDRQIPVSVHTAPRQTQEYTLGMGYGTDTGPRLSLGTEFRRLNQRGHRFKSDLRLSGVSTTVAAEYQIPVKDVATDTLSYRAQLGTQELGDLETDQLSLGASWNDTWRGMQRRLYLTAHREDWEEGGNPFSVNLLFPGMHLRSQQTADPLFTRKGYSWSSDIRGGSEALGSSTSFLRAHVTGAIVRPLGERARFLFRSEYGAIDAGDFASLPPSQRFFAGGDRSVRGYEYEQLAPEDANGATVGGRYLLIGTAELDYLFYGNYGAAVFVDAGNAANDPSPDLKRSVGIGFRWRSPVGMVRIDVAHPLDDPETDYRLHLSIGSDL
jgi:translocation and assembly module TamA